MMKHSEIINNKGISLIEIILSMGILVMVLVPTISLFASSVRNNKFTQDSIETKYLAERYMEIVKATPINDLASLLENTYNFSGGGSVFMNNEEGVRIEWDKVYDVQGSVSISSNINCDMDISMVSGSSLNVFAAATGSSISMTADDNVFVKNYDINDNPMLEESWSGTGSAGLINILLRFNKPVTVNVDNQTGRRLVFFCVNQGRERNSTTYHSFSSLPVINVLEGMVSLQDFTVSPEGERLDEESEDNFLISEPLGLAYAVTVDIYDTDGIVIYTLEGLKVVN